MKKPNDQRVNITMRQQITSLGKQFTVKGTIDTYDGNRRDLAEKVNDVAGKVRVHRHAFRVIGGTSMNSTTRRGC
jgi:hypothetical protein